VFTRRSVSLSNVSPCLPVSPSNCGGGALGVGPLAVWSADCCGGVGSGGLLRAGVTAGNAAVAACFVAVQAAPASACCACFVAVVGGGGGGGLLRAGVAAGSAAAGCMQAAPWHCQRCIGNDCAVVLRSNALADSSLCSVATTPSAATRRSLALADSALCSVAAAVSHMGFACDMSGWRECGNVAHRT